MPVPVNPLSRLICRRHNDKSPPPPGGRRTVQRPQSSRTPRHLMAAVGGLLTVFRPLRDKISFPSLRWSWAKKSHRIIRPLAGSASHNLTGKKVTIPICNKQLTKCAYPRGHLYGLAWRYQLTVFGDVHTSFFVGLSWIDRYK